MADTTVECAVGSFTKIVDNVSTDVTVTLLTDTPVYLKSTAADSQPAATTVGPQLFFAGAGWSEATVAEKFPGAGDYLWARPVDGSEIPALIFVSHA